MTTPESYDAQQKAEYGKYVAVEQIYIGGALAFNPGDPVPASTVDRDDSPIRKEQVAGAKTKAAEAATKEG